MSRSSTGGSTTFIGGGSAGFPVWLKLSRQGGWVSGFASNDGLRWTPVGAPAATPTGAALVGLAVTSHDTAVTNTAIFTGADVRKLPPGWTRTDVGSVGLAGWAAEQDGRFRVAGAGSDIWGHADSFTAVTTTLAGDGRVSARVVAERNTHPFAKAGVFFANSLSPTAARVILDLRPDGSIEFMARFADGQAMSFLAGATTSFPAYLRLTRSGDLITGAMSALGDTWTDVGSIQMPMSGTGVAGLGVTSHQPQILNVATFTHVAVESIAGGPAPPNLLRNAGFEEYAPPALGPPGWISDRESPARSESNEPRTGVNNGACRPATALECGIYQDVTAPVAGTYSLTLYANASRPGAWVGVNVNGAGARSAQVEVRGTGAYGAPYTLSFAAGAGDVIRVWLYSPAYAGAAVIDDGDLRY